MNILVTGANGQLGNEMRIVAKSNKLDKYIFTDVCDGYEHLDITDIEAIRKKEKDYDYLSDKRSTKESQLIRYHMEVMHETIPFLLFKTGKRLLIFDNDCLG